MKTRHTIPLIKSSQLEPAAGWELSAPKARVFALASNPGDRVLKLAIVGSERKTWLRKATFENGALKKTKVKPRDQGPEHKTWSLTPGLYETACWSRRWEQIDSLAYWQQAQRDAALVDRCWIVVVESEPPHCYHGHNSDHALLHAQEEGLLSPPEEADLWGSVRSECAKGWRAASRASKKYAKRAQTVEQQQQLEDYCTEALAGWSRKMAASLGVDQLRALEGTPKQKKWAELIRAEYCSGAAQIWTAVQAQDGGAEDLSSAIYQTLIAPLRFLRHSDEWISRSNCWGRHQPVEGKLKRLAQDLLLRGIEEWERSPVPRMAIFSVTELYP